MDRNSGPSFQHIILGIFEFLI